MAELHTIPISDSNNLNLTPQKVATMNQTCRKNNINLDEETFKVIRKKRETYKKVNLELKYGSKRCLKSILKVWKSMKKIENITFIQREDYELADQDQDIKAFCLPLRKHNTVKSLYFQLNSGKISDSTIHSFSQYIKPCKISKKLSLNFIDSKKITEKGFRILCTSINRCKKVQEVGLNTPWCTKIYIQKPLVLQQTLKRLVSLRSLRINLISCPEISDKVLKSLSISLKSLLLLQRIQLNFARCSKITAYGVKKLTESFKDLRLLETVDLNFSGTLIAKESLEYLREALRKLEFLNEIWLDFRGCQEITGDMVKRLREGLISKASLRKIVIFHLFKNS